MNVRVFGSDLTPECPPISSQVSSLPLPAPPAVTNAPAGYAAPDCLDASGLTAPKDCGWEKYPGQLYKMTDRTDSVSSKASKLVKHSSEVNGYNSNKKYSSMGRTGTASAPPNASPTPSASASSP